MNLVLERRKCFIFHRFSFSIDNRISSNACAIWLRIKIWIWNEFNLWYTNECPSCCHCRTGFDSDTFPCVLTRTWCRPRMSFSNSIKGLFNTWDGEPSLLYNLPKIRAESNGELTPAQGLSDEEGKQMILGPISLGGEKKGDLFQIEVESFWKWEWNTNNANKFTIRNLFKIVFLSQGWQKL